MSFVVVVDGFCMFLHIHAQLRAERVLSFDMILIQINKQLLPAMF